MVTIMKFALQINCIYFIIIFYFGSRKIFAFNVDYTKKKYIAFASLLFRSTWKCNRPKTDIYKDLVQILKLKHNQIFIIYVNEIQRRKTVKEKHCKAFCCSLKSGDFIITILHILCKIWNEAMLIYFEYESNSVYTTHTVRFSSARTVVIGIFRITELNSIADNAVLVFDIRFVIKWVVVVVSFYNR